MNRSSSIQAQGPLDEESGEFWFESPFQIADSGENLSAFEKNRMFLNTGGLGFVDASFSSGAAIDSDSRSVVAADFTGDGRADLLVGSAGGGPLRLFRNEFPDASRWVRLLLRGTISNRSAIGARVILRVDGDREIVRDLFPANGFQGQGPCELLIGVGDAQVIDQLTVRWPTSRVQTYRNLPTNRVIQVREWADPRGNFKPFDHDDFSGTSIISERLAHEVIDHREKNAPLIGEKAPPFEVQRLGSEETTTLGNLHREKPVVLVFSSQTCQVFEQGLESLLRVHERFGDKANFAMIYLREAHPAALPGGLADPSTDLQRHRVAALCREEMNLPFEVLVDGVADGLGTRWASWPTRLFVVDREGVVIYAGPTGPWGYRPGTDFIHGDGQFDGWDLNFSSESLEDFLAHYFED